MEHTLVYAPTNIPELSLGTGTEQGPKNGTVQRLDVLPSRHVMLLADNQIQGGDFCVIGHMLTTA